MGKNDGDELVVKYGGLDEISSRLNHQAKTLEHTLDEIKSLVTQAAAGWEGDAQTTYASVQKAWDKDAQAVKAALSSISKAVADASQHYGHGDKKAASYFQ